MTDTATDPEVERLATVCARAHQAVITEWINDPQGAPFPMPTVCWRAVGLAVRAALEALRAEVAQLRADQRMEDAARGEATR